MSQALAAAALAALVVLSASAALGPLQGTLAWHSDGDGAEGSFGADLPVGSSCALWAGRAGTSMLVAARGGIVRGCLHGNGDVRVTGDGNEWLRTLRHAGAVTISGRDNVLHHGPVRVAPEAYLYALDAAAYAPGGAIAQEEAARGTYHAHVGSNVLLRGAGLARGLHHVQGNVTVQADALPRNVTIVATGWVVLDIGHAEALGPYRDGILAQGGSAGTSTLDCDRGRAEGAVLALAGTLLLRGGRCVLVGQLAAGALDLTGKDHDLTARPPPFWGP